MKVLGQSGAKIDFWKCIMMRSTSDSRIELEALLDTLQDGRPSRT